MGTDKKKTGNTKTHTIPTYPDPSAKHELFGSTYTGHFKSEARVLISGTPASVAPGGFGVGGWDETGEGRRVFQGPMVKGPVAYLFGRGASITSSPHTGTCADMKREEAAGLLFRVDAGDELVVDGERYALEVCPRGYPTLNHISAVSN